MDNALKILIVSPEAAPFAKSGGLGDVAGTLPRELRKLGFDARLVIPKYKNIPERFLRGSEYVGSAAVNLSWRRNETGVYKLSADFPVYVVENDYYFNRDGFYGYGDDYERFAFFCKAAIECLPVIGFLPDVIHFNDWQTGLGCVYFKDVYKKFTCFNHTKTVYTIHNLQYQGIFGREILGSVDINDGYFTPDKLEFHGNASFMKAGLTYSDAVSTVSPTYADEIQRPEYGYGMDGMLRSRRHELYGIINGLDYEKFNPETDEFLPHKFSRDDLSGKAANKAALQRELNLPERPDAPMITLISRLATQKGMDILAGCVYDLMYRDVQFVALGAGEGRYEHMFKELAWRFPDKMSANIRFDEGLAQRIYAAGDLFLMPSLFEPCGLGQLIAMRYGNIPITRKTGGLNDTVRNYDRFSKQGNGFVFEDYLSSGLMWAVNEALGAYYDKNEWRQVVRNAMECDFSWDLSARKYAEMYKEILEK